MFPVMDRFPGLAVVLQAPDFRPEFLIIGRDHAALAARGHDLVLAE
jgi:hypothetical protein